MSVFEPSSRKRVLQSENISEAKRQCMDLEGDAFSDKMYTLFVKSAMESLEKVCLKLRNDSEQAIFYSLD